jgi:3-oxoacyl-[acyl-carrier protein] reductase
MTTKLALITGGSRGIGKEIALALAKEGNNIAISYGNNSESAMEVVKEIQSFGVEAIAVKADVSIAEDVKNLIKIIEEGLGTIDILVNNAGITKDNLLIRMTEEDWDNVMDVNLKGVFLCTKAVSRSMMKKRYGKIINITSVVGITGNAGQGNYSASKAGVIGFTKSMAKELASRGIRVNAVAPGLIQTDMTNVLKDEVKAEMLKMIPLNTMGNPVDIANLVVFLAGEKSDYITGQIIKIDGGMAI